MVVAGGGGDLHDRLTDANLSLDRSGVRFDDDSLFY